METATAGIADALTLTAEGRPAVVVDWKSDVAPAPGTLDHYRALGRNAARYACGDLPEPVVVTNHGEAMGSRYHARVALIYAIETSLTADGAAPEEIEVSLLEARP